MEQSSAVLIEHPFGQIARVVGLYQTFLRRMMEHFFPDAALKPAGDRSYIRWEGPSHRANYRLSDEPDGLGVEIEWFRTHYLLVPGRPAPFLPAERRVIASILRVLDDRFRSLFDPAVAQGTELLHYALEDLIVAEYLGLPDPARMPAALEALRVAALSTYENRKVSTGVLLLGTDHDPAAPDRRNPPGAPRYSVRLSALKSIHRLTDGINTVFLVDRRGDLAWAVDVARWADQVQGPDPLDRPCPRPFQSHAKATRTGGHACLILTPSQEIKVFARGTLGFAFSDARWRLLDIPTRFEAWCQAVGATRPKDLAMRLFQAALNLAENREGALFVILRDPGRSLAQLVGPGDRIVTEPEGGESEAADPDHISPRMAKQALHHLVYDQHIQDLDASVLESLATIDGAVVTDADGRLLAFGAILRVSPEALASARAVEGARTAAALTASFHGPVLKVSQDGTLDMYLGGRRVWAL